MSLCRSKVRKWMEEELERNSEVDPTSPRCWWMTVDIGRFRKAVRGGRLGWRERKRWGKGRKGRRGEREKGNDCVYRCVFVREWNRAERKMSQDLTRERERERVRKRERERERERERGEQREREREIKIERGREGGRERERKRERERERGREREREITRRHKSSRHEENLPRFNLLSRHWLGVLGALAPHSRWCKVE